jgi:tetratricopeptide (TPR) repeat protein
MDYDRLRELQQKFDENPRRYFAPLANEYRKGGQPKRAIEICRAHLAQMPGHMSGQIVYGQSLYEAGEFDEAKEIFARALSLDPENLIALRTLGDMELQAGNTTEARSWYARLLDADPKDTAVIALVSEIDAAADASPIGTTEIPGIDTDAGDQQIPGGIETSSELIFLHKEPGTPAAESEPVDDAPQAEASHAETSHAETSHAETSQTETSQTETSDTVASAPDSQSADSPAVEAPAAAPSSAADEAPLGLERHYPVQDASPPESEPHAAQASSVEASSPESPAAEAPVQAGSTEGLTAEDLGVAIGDSAADGLKSVIPEAGNPLDWSGPPPAAAVEEAAAPPAPEPERVPIARAPEPEPIARAAEPPRAPEPPSRAPEPPPRAPEAPRAEEKTFSGASSEPFVNETMAQLYLQQGYKQLALQVYRQLAVSRPHDEGLRNRIAEIETADAAEHPGEVAARKETPVAKPSAPEEAAGRQPSIREFFATLGRRRPPAPSSRGRASSGSGVSQPAPVDMRPPLGAAPQGASLDSVFAGATVSAADARAASRLAGAFSSTSGPSRTPSPTPPIPTPRVNPRVPQAQESEEDVAKFRAWLDGLTGE